MKLVWCEFGDTVAINLVTNLLWYRTSTLRSGFSPLSSRSDGAWVWRWWMTDDGRGEYDIIVAIVPSGRVVAFLEEHRIARSQAVLVAAAIDGDDAAGARPSVRFRTGAEPAAFLSGAERLTDAQEKRVIDQLLRSFVPGAETLESRGFVSRTLLFRGSDEMPEERMTN